MNRRTFLLSLSVATLSSAAWAQHGHGDDSHGYVGPAPGSLGGAIALSDLAGRPFTDANFVGSWTLLYFGYANCRSACPTALPNLSDALTRLRSARVAAQAVFVEIEAPAAPMRLRSQAPAPNTHNHRPSGAVALSALAEQFGDIRFLTGSRAQLRQAFTAFRVRAEHVPPRTDLGEQGHSINHTSAIYLIDPTSEVAGYLRHDATPSAIAQFVLARARR
jgi:protein SCO1/2